MESRIPIRDALSVFVPENSPCPTSVEEMMKRTGESRWYPKVGGHRVLILYDGGKYDFNIFALEKGAWDHSECMYCNERIEAMELCHVTKPGYPYVLLCENCYKAHVPSKKHFGSYLLRYIRLNRK